jgi:hypothetical protein
MINGEQERQNPKGINTEVGVGINAQVHSIIIRNFRCGYSVTAGCQDGQQGAHLLPHPPEVAGGDA